MRVATSSARARRNVASERVNTDSFSGDPALLYGSASSNQPSEASAQNAQMQANYEAARRAAQEQGYNLSREEFTLPSDLANKLAMKRRLQQQMAGGGLTKRFGAALPKGQEQSATGDTTQLPLFGKSLADYLAGADPSQFSADLLASIAAQESNMRNQANLGDAQIARIYAALVSQIQGQDAQIAKQYSDAQEATNANTQAAAQAMRTGTDSSGSALDSALTNLGITPGSGQGTGNLEYYSQGGTSDLAKHGQAAANYLVQMGVGQRDFNRGNATAAGYRGAEARTALQQQLLDALADLNSQRAEVNANARAQALDMAYKQYQADYGQFQDQRAFETGRDDQAFQRGLALAQAQGSATPEMLGTEQLYSSLSQTVGSQEASNIWNIILATAGNANVKTNMNPANFLNAVRIQAQKLYPENPAMIALATQYASEYYKQYGG